MKTNMIQEVLYIYRLSATSKLPLACLFPRILSDVRRKYGDDANSGEAVPIASPSRGVNAVVSFGGTEQVHCRFSNTRKAGRIQQTAYSRPTCRSAYLEGKLPFVQARRLQREQSSRKTKRFWDSGVGGQFIEFLKRLVQSLIAVGHGTKWWSCWCQYKKWRRRVAHLARGDFQKVNIRTSVITRGFCIVAQNTRVCGSSSQRCQCW
jgi:hypothetical protein